jgi:hypothetical protein
MNEAHMNTLAKHLENAAKPVVAARFYDVPADAIESVARKVPKST